MNRAYWDAQAAQWDDAIFDSLREDVRGVVRRALRAAAREHTRILDFGCGVGGYLRFLAGAFQQVHAIDWSAACVEAATHRTAGLPNVTVRVSSARVLRELERSVGCVLAANVVIHPDARMRRALWRSIRRVVRRGSTGIFVLPSLESAAYCEFVRRRVAPRRPSAYDFHPRLARAEAGGVVSIEGVPTKHYTAEELEATLADSGFGRVRLARVRYRWSTESLAPPRALRAQLPWDWLAVAHAT